MSIANLPSKYIVTTVFFSIVHGAYPNGTWAEGIKIANYMKI
jgi:hypothetical protein